MDGFQFVEGRSDSMNDPERAAQILGLQTVTLSDPHFSKFKDSTVDAESNRQPQIIPRNVALTHFHVRILLVDVIIVTITTYLESKGTQLRTKYSSNSFTWKCSYYGGYAKRVNFNLTIYRAPSSSDGNYVIQMTKADHGNHQAFYTLYKEVKSLFIVPEQAVVLAWPDIERSEGIFADSNSDNVKEALLASLTSPASTNTMLNNGLELANGIYGPGGQIIVPSDTDEKIIGALMQIACESECKGDWTCVEAIGLVGTMLGGCAELAGVVVANTAFVSLMRALGAVDPFASPLGAHLQSKCSDVLNALREKLST